jgi:hypothetical protein
MLVGTTFLSGRPHAGHGATDLGVSARTSGAVVAKWVGANRGSLVSPFDKRFMPSGIGPPTG